jgi:hypothetical protein
MKELKRTEEIENIVINTTYFILISLGLIGAFITVCLLFM